MDRQSLLLSLRDRVVELERMIRYFGQADRIRQLDVDLFKEKIRNLYDEVAQLNQVSQEAPEPEPKPVPKPAPEPEPIAVTEPEPMPEPERKPEPKPEPEPRPEPKPEPEPVSEPAPVSPPRPEPTPPPPKPAPSSTAQPVKPSQSLGEKMKPKSEAVNEIYGKAKASLRSTSNLQPISDILIAIGLNDRFLFTRELFNNNSDLFKQTVSRLNGLSGYDEAISYLKNTFDWNWDDDLTEHFMQIVKRRYL